MTAGFPMRWFETGPDPIEDVLEDGHLTSSGADKAGPDTELKFWRDTHIESRDERENGRVFTTFKFN